MELLNTLYNLMGLVFVLGTIISMGLSLAMKQITGPLRNVRFVIVALLANFIIPPILALNTTRYAKKVPGHHVQLDVKFLRLTDSQGKIVKRYQYTAVDDATRIRALRVYPKRNQACAI